MGSRLTAAGREAWALIADLWFGDENHDRFHRACQAIDVSPPQLKCLLSLEPGQVRPMRALAEVLRCDASWVTGLVDGLEEHGYVERQVHPTDRRIKVVTITSQGEDAKARAKAALAEPPLSIAALSPVEQRELRDLLAKLHNAGHS